MKRIRSTSFCVSILAAAVTATALVSCASGGSPDQPPTDGNGLLGSGGYANNPAASGGLGGLAGGGAFPSSSGGAPSGTGGVVGAGNGGSAAGAGGTIGNGGGSNGGLSNGGATSSGGSPSGGTPGGGSSTGGSAGATGSCTDTPPPNGDTCAHAVLYQWCGAPWMLGACAQSCGMCSGGATGGATGTGGRTSTGGTTNTGGTTSTGGVTSTGGTTSTGGNPPPIQGGQTGWASRYWDCCKPACGWTGNVSSGKPMSSCDQSNQSLGASYDVQNACDGGGAYMCWSGAPWSVNDTLSYGFAAASGTNYTCGRCYQLQFSGSGHSSNDPGAASLNGKTMIVQVINNGGVEGDQFDLLIPGGGVGANNACSTQWGTSDLGAQYGGFLTGCNGDKSCVQQKCNSVFAGKSDLLAGCSWFLGWFDGADNPNLEFKQIACPSAITSRSGLTDPG